MLHQTALATKRVLRLLSRPVRNANPTEHMTARRDAWVLHSLQAQCAIPVSCAYPAHCSFVAELISGRVCHWRVGPFLELGCRRLGMRRVEKERIVCAIGVGVQGDFCLLYTSPSPRDGLLSRMPSSA